MKLSELRIGNYVDIKHDEYEHKSFQFEFENGWNMEFVQPIPLTEEWLLKFGFEKIKNNREFFYSDVFKHEKNAYNTWFCVYFFNYNATGESAQYYKSYFETRHHGKIEYLDNYGNFDYVHQLQNLYFALTGKELTIKK